MTGRAIGIIALVCAILTAPLTADAQQAAKAPRIGLLWGGSPSAVPQQYEAFRQGLQELGWVEGQNIVIEHRAADNRNERLPKLAAELVQMDVRVILAINAAAARAAKQATSTIPIVMVAVGDPVRYGLVTSLARPDANVTGLAFLANELIAKQLQLLKEAAPKVARVGVFVNRTNPAATSYLEDAQAAAQALGLKIIPAEVRGADDFDGAFSMIVRERGDALLVAPEALIFSQRQRIVAFADRQRLPTVFGSTVFMKAGGLMAYSASSVEIHRRAATYVDKILKGAKPGDLPVEQPTKFEFVINLKTAKALGLTIPQSVLIRADEVIR